MIHSLPRLRSVQTTWTRCELIKACFVNDLVYTSVVGGNGVNPLPSQGALHSLLLTETIRRAWSGCREGG